MTRAKIAITIEDNLLESLDFLVQNRIFKNRSQAINEALKEKLQKVKKTRLEQECKKLSPQEEQEWAELGLEEDAKEWSQY